MTSSAFLQVPLKPVTRRSRVSPLVSLASASFLRSSLRLLCLSWLCHGFTRVAQPELEALFSAFFKKAFVMICWVVPTLTIAI